MIYLSFSVLLFGLVVLVQIAQVHGLRRDVTNLQMRVNQLARRSQL